MRTKLSCEDVVMFLKTRGLSTNASAIADAMGTDSLAVATALRGATKDGRVTINYKRNIGYYRFKRLTPNA